MLSYEAFLTRTGGVKQRSSRMSRWIAESGRRSWVESAGTKVTRLDHGGCHDRPYLLECAPEAGQDLGIDFDRLPGVVSFELRKNLELLNA